MSHYPITHPLTVIQAGLSVYPCPSSFKHPQHNLVYIAAAGPRVDNGAKFSDIHVTSWAGDAPFDPMHLENIIMEMLEMLGVPFVRSTGYPGTDKIGFAPEPQILTAHEKIEAIARVRELLSEVMRRIPQLEEICPDLFRPRTV